jgi:excisionase family DNA binding protein
MASPVYSITPVESEEEQIKSLYKLLLKPGHASLVGPDGSNQPIPESVYKVLVAVLGKMQEGKTIALLPIMEELTSKAAADMLGVSRQFLVRMLEDGKIPFHRTGTHRRIYFKDLVEYQTNRNAARHQAIENMAKRELDEGTYDAFVLPDDQE